MVSKRNRRCDVLRSSWLHIDDAEPGDDNVASPGSVGLQDAFLMLVDFEGFGELVLQDHDAAGGFNGGAVVGDVSYSGGQAKLVPAVAAVPAAGTHRVKQVGVLNRAQECWGGADHFGGTACRVGRVVLVVESVR